MGRIDRTRFGSCRKLSDFLTSSLPTPDGSAINSTVVTTTLTVINTAPTASLNNSGPINEAGTATVNFANQSDPSPVDQAALLYSFDFNNNGIFDVGVDIVDSANATATIPASLLTQNGFVTIRGVVKDPNGASSEAFTSLTINDVAPNIVLSGSTTNIVEGSVFTLNAVVTDPGADTISQWDIEWGDGNVETFAGNLRAFSHTYAMTDRIRSKPPPSTPTENTRTPSVLPSSRAIRFRRLRT